MKYQMRILQGWKLAALVAVALSMGACAKNNVGADGAMASAATPGSQQDFVVNVGDRVFFESDQTELSPQAIATLEKQQPSGLKQKPALQYIAGVVRGLR